MATRIANMALVWTALVPVCSAILFQHQRAEPSVYPVSKVVELLRSMQTQLEKEGDADQEVYEKLACWCETNDKTKTKAIADAQAHLSNLEGTIQNSAALSATLKVEIEGLEKEIATNQQSLATATALRQKQKADFIGEEKEMVQSIQALNAAVTVLAKHHEGASASSSVAAALATIKTQLQRHGEKFQGVITPRQRRALSALVQVNGAGGDYFDSTPTYKQAYQVQSGEIFGILKQMKATFEADLSASQREELAAQQAYEGVKVAKEQQIATGQAALQDKKEQLAKADQTLVQAKMDEKDTRASLNADQAFLTDLKMKCSMTDQQWQDRQQIRADEIAAVANAIALLSSDDARDLFSRTLNRKAAMFVQVQDVETSKRRHKAIALLSEAAAKAHNPKLSMLADAVRLDSFTRVKKAIDDMVTALVQEKDEEVKHRDFCIAEMNTNEKSTARELHTKQNLESKVAGLDMKIQGLTKTIATLQAEIDDLKVQRDRAKENRDLENSDFQGVIKDQRDSEGLLQQALDVLKSQYAASMIQQARQSPPADFQAYEKNGQSPGVLGLLEHIIQNIKLMQEKTLQAEQSAQDAYTAFVQECSNSEQVKKDGIVDRTSEKAQAEQDLLSANSELSGTVTELQTLEQGAADLQSSCGYTIKNFDVRQEARDQEIEALRQAKAFLSGME